MAVETLVCQACGEDWERELKRGRKPKTCPDCKSSNRKVKSKKVKPSGVAFGNIVERKGLTEDHGFYRYDEVKDEDGNTVTAGTKVKMLNDRRDGEYKVRAYVEPNEGRAYFDVIGTSDLEQGKFYSLDPQRIVIQ